MFWVGENWEVRKINVMGNSDAGRLPAAWILGGRWWIAIVIVLLSNRFLCAELKSTEEEFSHKIVSFLLIKDFEGARQSCETAMKIFPDSSQLKSLHIRSLAQSGRCDEALQLFHRVRGDHHLADNFDLLEGLAWGILLQKEKNSQLGTIAALIGAYLTQDARAVNLLCEGLQSTNAFLRTVAVQFASNYNDRILQREILRLLGEEKNWFVKRELISAVGKMRLKEASAFLEEVIASQSVTNEEKVSAIQSLIAMRDDVSKNELKQLVKSQRSGFRELAISLVDHFEKEEWLCVILPLLDDSSPAVRMRLLTFLGSKNFGPDLYASIEKRLKNLSKDVHPEVAILSNWVMLRIDPDQARASLCDWVVSNHLQGARFAAAAIHAGGMETLPILEKTFHEAQDDYVRLNLAHSMLQQGVEREKAGQFIRKFLLSHKEKVMMREGIYPAFNLFAPSEVRHIPSVARYPEIVDQLTRLRLLNSLAIAGISDLKEIAKVYLQGQVWGVVGSAAVFFLEEQEMASIDLVKELLNDDDQTVRIQAALVLAFYGGEKRAAQVLEEAYTKVDWDKKISILEALGHIGAKESVPFLLKILEEPFTLPRTIAASSLIQCLYH